MPREIKFRAKSLDSGEWVFGVPILGKIQTDLGWMAWVEPKRKAEFGEMCIPLRDVVQGEKIDPKTVGEYTWLKDKNGAEIYEGDVIQANLPQMPSGEQLVKNQVYYADGSFKIWNKWDAVRLDGLRHIYGATWEVLGNIHDNPDLLEVSHG